MFMPNNINYVAIIITLKGIEQVKGEKKKKQQLQNSLKNISFPNTVRKHQQRL